MFIYGDTNLDERSTLWGTCDLQVINGTEDKRNLLPLDFVTLHRILAQLSYYGGL